jgi:hypothetical protein
MIISKKSFVVTYDQQDTASYIKRRVVYNISPSADDLN